MRYIEFQPFAILFSLIVVIYTTTMFIVIGVSDYLERVFTSIYYRIKKQPHPVTKVSAQEKITRFSRIFSQTDALQSLTLYPLLSIPVMTAVRQGYFSRLEIFLLAVGFVRLFVLPFLEFIFNKDFDDKKAAAQISVLLFISFILPNELKALNNTQIPQPQEILDLATFVGFILFLMFQFEISKLLFSKKSKRETETISRYFDDPQFSKKERLSFNVIIYAIPLIPFFIWRIIPHKFEVPNWVYIGLWIANLASMLIPFVVIFFAELFTKARVRLVARRLELAFSSLTTIFATLLILYGINFFEFFGHFIQSKWAEVSPLVVDGISKFIGMVISGVVGNRADAWLQRLKERALSKSSQNTPIKSKKRGNKK